MLEAALMVITLAHAMSSKVVRYTMTSLNKVGIGISYNVVCNSYTTTKLLKDLCSLNRKPHKYLVKQLKY